MFVVQIFDDYVKSVKEKSEDLVKNVFPKRISELNDMLESAEFNMDLQKDNLRVPVNIPVPDAQAIMRAINNSHGHGEEDGPAGKKRKYNNQNNHIHEDADGDVITTSGTKVLALPTGPIGVNTTITRMFDMVKPQIRQLVEISNLVRKMSSRWFFEKTDIEFN